MIPLITACVLLAVGVYGVLVRRDVVGVLACLEIVIGSVLLLVVSLRSGAAAEVDALLLLVLAAAEAAVGLSLLVSAVRANRVTMVDEYTEVRDR